MCQFRPRDHTQSLSGKTGPCLACAPHHTVLVNALLPCLIFQHQPKATATSQACCPTLAKFKCPGPKAKPKKTVTLSSAQPETQSKTL